MKNRIDYILLGLLWLLATTLATTFWFNTAFGFNIFSAQHWQYLAYMQATHQPVKPLFYISLTASILMTVAGLYILMRPRLRRIKLPIFVRTKKSDTITKTKQPSTPAPPHNPDASSITITAAPIARPPHTPSSVSTVHPNTPSAPKINRPAHLALPTKNSINAATHAAPAVAVAPRIQTSTPNATQYITELKQIFESTGYTVKESPKIRTVQTALLAICTPEILWLGAVGIKTADMQMAIDRLQQVFVDTLDDIKINITGFVINATDAATPEYKDILTFDSVDAVREYMSAHPAPPVLPDDLGDFDAYSAYISTVADYIGKI